MATIGRKHVNYFPCAICSGPSHKVGREKTGTQRYQCGTCKKTFRHPDHVKRPGRGPVVWIPAAPNTEGSRIYQPPNWAWNYLLAVLDIEIKPTITARCEVARIDKHLYYDAVKDVKFIEWLNANLERVVLGEGPEIRSALRRKCLSGDLEAIKLWHELYGKYVPTTRQIVKDEREISELGNAELSEIARILARHNPKGTGETIN